MTGPDLTNIPADPPRPGGVAEVAQKFLARTSESLARAVEWDLATVKSWCGLAATVVIVGATCFLAFGLAASATPSPFVPSDGTLEIAAAPARLIVGNADRILICATDRSGHALGIRPVDPATVEAGETEPPSKHAVLASVRAERGEVSGGIPWQCEQDPWADPCREELESWDIGPAATMRFEGLECVPILYYAPEQPGVYDLTVSSGTERDQVTILVEEDPESSVGEVPEDDEPPAVVPPL